MAICTLYIAMIAGHMWFVPKVSVLIFLCTNWQHSTLLMYIGMLVVTLIYVHACFNWIG